ncbi:hypothetical protein ACFL27_22425, partial [candidate division CSSED10-310 bacterium]
GELGPDGPNMAIAIWPLSDALRRRCFVCGGFSYHTGRTTGDLRRWRGCFTILGSLHWEKRPDVEFRSDHHTHNVHHPRWEVSGARERAWDDGGVGASDGAASEQVADQSRSGNLCGTGSLGTTDGLGAFRWAPACLGTARG